MTRKLIVLILKIRVFNIIRAFVINIKINIIILINSLLRKQSCFELLICLEKKRLTDLTYTDVKLQK